MPMVFHAKNAELRVLNVEKTDALAAQMLQKLNVDPIDGYPILKKNSPYSIEINGATDEIPTCIQARGDQNRFGDDAPVLGRT